jgi:hypothetical protein
VGAGSGHARRNPVLDVGRPDLAQPPGKSSGTSHCYLLISGSNLLSGPIRVGEQLVVVLGWNDELSRMASKA